MYETLGVVNLNTYQTWWLDNTFALDYKKLIFVIHLFFYNGVRK